jgi:uncharacterized membrane protein
MRGRLVDLREGSALVGSTDDCDVMVCSDHVSRRHALVTNFEKHTYVEDLKSSNGTIVNGQRCTGRTELHDGDTIRFADVAARYEVVTAGSGPTTVVERPTQLPTSSTAHVAQYDIDHQQAAAINNVARDQYLIEQRDSFARDIASTKSRARFAIWTGAVLAVVGFVVIGVGAYRYFNGFTSLNGTSAEDQANSVFRSYTHFFFAGGATFFVGMVLLITGIVMHVVAASRRKQLNANPAWANLPPGPRGSR